MSTGTTGSYPEEYKEYFIEVMYDVFINLVNNKTPFKLALHVTDDWSIPLTDEMKKLKALVIDLADQSLEDSYYDASKGLVFISTGFDGQQATKYIEPIELLAMLDITSGQPFMLRPFSMTVKSSKPKMQHNGEEIKLPKTVEGLVQGLIDDGLNPDNARQSVEAFVKNNPELAQKFK